MLFSRRGASIGRGSCVSKNATVLAVYEDWAGGAGNALGTLYAFKKASTLAETKGFDLPGKMAAGEVRPWALEKRSRQLCYSGVEW